MQWNHGIIRKQFEEIIVKKQEIRNYLNERETKDILKKNESIENLNHDI